MNISAEKWTPHQVAGHMCDVFMPQQRNEHGYVILYLHGVQDPNLHFSELRGKQTFLDLFEKNGLAVVSPQCGPCWWTNRLSRAFDQNLTAQSYLLDNVLPFIADELGTEPPRVALLGTSMGGQGALKLSYLFPDTFPIVSAIAPAVDFQLRVREGDPILMEMYGDPESARQDTAILHIHPLNWPRNQFYCCDPADRRWFDSSDRLRMKLGSLGVPFECDLETSAGGHSFDYYNHMAEKAIGYLATALDRERLRVV